MAFTCATSTAAVAELEAAVEAERASRAGRATSRSRRRQRLARGQHVRGRGDRARQLFLACPEPVLAEPELVGARA